MTVLLRTAPTLLENDWRQLAEEIVSVAAAEAQHSADGIGTHPARGALGCGSIYASLARPAMTSSRTASAREHLWSAA
jgi:hypothetical protein